MRKRLLSMFALGFLVSVPLMADTVTCESEDNRQKECAMDTSGSVRIVRQLSDTTCVEGVNWGRNRQSIWVKNGCRAVFESSGGYSGAGSRSGGYGSSAGLPMRVTCESVDNRLKQCTMDTSGGVRIVRQLSDTRCVEGSNWGRSGQSIWVKNGCRAEFESSGYGYGSSAGLPTRVACESVDNRLKECTMDTRNGVRIVRQLSDTRCVEGANWGRNRQSIWVKNGCRAEFESSGMYSGGGSRSGGYGSGSSSGLPTRVACESVDNRLKECTMDTRNGVRIVRQLSDTRCVEGANWGRNRQSIWVKNGCRAEFESSGMYSGGGSGSGGYGSGSSSGLPTRVTCVSEYNRQQQCAMDTRGNVRIVRQLSDTRCVEGENWGRNRQSIWVKNGCRAEFELERNSGSNER
jgi:hypothetical protein